VKNRIIDNSTEKNSLLYRLKEYINNSKGAKIVTGYFFVKGFNKIIDDLKDLDGIDLLIGNTSSKETVEEIALGYRYYDDIKKKVYKDQRKLNKRDKALLISKTSNDTKLSIETADITDENEKSIKRLADFIKEKKLRVKVYLQSKLHSKAYIFDYKKYLYDENGKKIKRSEDGISIIGSSNFTLAGLTHNTELNVVIDGNDEHDYLKRWFNNLWGRSEDFSEELFNQLNSSWALNYPTPYEVYLKILYHLAKEKIENGDSLVLEVSDIFSDLTKFQKIAVAQAINILEKYYGVFISDVVGLGKSFIGSALIDYYHRKGKRTLIICPAKLEHMWREYNNLYDLGAETLSMGVLSQKDGYERINKYKDKEIILIDESHNFRNNDSDRYKNISDFLIKGDKKVILMTATPQNNTPYDVYNQIKLFHPEDETNIPITPANLRSFTNEVVAGKENFQSLLQRLLIRRTRAHIKKYYPDEKINGKLIIFPKRNIPEPIPYSIEDVYQNMYEEILDYLMELTYARYNLFYYVKKDFKDKSPYVGLQSAGKNLRGFIKVLLLKRIESSIDAFRKTIDNLVNVHENYISAIEELKLLPIGDRAQDLLYSVDDILDYTSELEKIIDKSGEKYDLECFDINNLKNDLTNDLKVFKKIAEVVSNITPDKDDKLQKLKEKIKEIKKENDKVLIFSQFADTTKYLYGQMKEYYKDELAEANSQSTNLLKIVRRFSPYSNNASKEEIENPINILISTDVLSEGQNLQDCSVVINYDIHWNPVRLIQRVGRVDRIGSESDKIDIYNFFPEAKLEKKLKIKERVTKRIQEIHNIFGEDGKYLSDNEILNTDDMYAIYEKRDESILDEEEFIINEAEGIIRKLQKENPELFNKIKNMSDNVRCIRKKEKEKFVIFCKKGNSYSFYITDKEGNIITQNDDEALRLVKAEVNEAGLAKLPKGANRIIQNIFNKFKEKIEKIKAERDRRLGSRKVGQDFVLKSLDSLREGLNSFSIDYEERKNKIDELYDIFSNILPTATHRVLKKLKKENIYGEELIKELIKIRNEFSLSKERKGEIVREDEIPKVVCSQIFVSGK